MSNRREFIVQLGFASSAVMAGNALAAAPVLDAADPQAKALGYVADAAKTDKVKFPKFATGQACSNCALFQAASNGCPLFAGKQVAAKGWCSAYAKKA